MHTTVLSIPPFSRHPNRQRPPKVPTLIMDLGSEQVSDDGYEWSQGLLNRGDPDLAVPPKQVLRRPQQQTQPVQQQQQGPPLKCPRCDSTNTKFCYYNNYSRTQPRHYCKACKRHWTNGGTLRNVPVGGRRKAKRPKTSRQSSAPNCAADANGTIVSDGHILPTTTQPSQQVLPPPPFGSLLQSPLPPSDYVDDCDVSSSYLCTLLHLPPVPQIGGCMMSSRDGTTTTSSPFPSLLSFTEQDDMAGEDAGIVVPVGTTWELLPPTSGSIGPSVGCSTVTTTASSDLTVPESSFPSSGYWGSCWDDLIGFPSADHHKQYPPPLLPPPQDLPLS